MNAPKSMEIAVDNIDNRIQCGVCGYIDDENKWFSIISNLRCCPKCGTAKFVCDETRGYRKE